MPLAAAMNLIFCGRSSLVQFFKQFSTMLTLFIVAVRFVSGTFNTAKRLPSGCKSKLETPPGKSVNWPGDQSWGLPAGKVSAEPDAQADIAYCLSRTGTGSSRTLSHGVFIRNRWVCVSRFLITPNW
jgi:hypothetical protein